MQPLLVSWGVCVGEEVQRLAPTPLCAWVNYQPIIGPLYLLVVKTIVHIVHRVFC